ncbi:16S rRNA (guanine(966)-N(2))-methyltransferase RsmD [Brevibacillus sp. 7WMA2]|uniref:16S rRNA (guanine(966)-N(2))-methyltransferase RsmD n=1 Tax=Brevibacillus sp. 7WMA2 TaxID=2683193 RepID=UPI0013A7948D|nr:16S rRNA (guanine(966)-N(2))-methyltransferase RsmD [Brevibacillus sp. 7WMA2]QIC05708.1 16S rRNA (guanine(966)-N(2))-methyltransferase RsmD [Brevibacillus sp. 7WMA2]
MRVISGEHRGRSLAAVPGTSTRPTTDKVKESIFNMIGPYFDGEWALDLYAGTGGLGIEALSRGAAKAIFVDSDNKAFNTVKQNLKTLRLDEQAEVYKIDSARALKVLSTRGVQFDLVFLDPPYAKQKLEQEIEQLQQLHMVATDAWIVTEHDAKLTLPEQIGMCEQYRCSTYGDTRVTIYRYIVEGDS